MDMPKNCAECQLYYNECGNPMCEGIGRPIHITDSYVRQEWCPLREVPQKKTKTMDMEFSKMCEVDGYNACIDEILGGGE